LGSYLGQGFYFLVALTLPIGRVRQPEYIKRWPPPASEGAPRLQPYQENLNVVLVPISWGYAPYPKGIPLLGKVLALSKVSSERPN